MTGYYFTFGLGYSLRDHHVKVTAPDEVTARRMFIAARGGNQGWCGVYHGADWDRYQERWPTTEVPIDTPCTYLYERTTTPCP